MKISDIAVCVLFFAEALLLLCFFVQYLVLPFFTKDPEPGEKWKLDVNDSEIVSSIVEVFEGVVRYRFILDDESYGSINTKDLKMFKRIYKRVK